MFECCNIVFLWSQKCFVEEETSPDVPSARGSEARLGAQQTEGGNKKAHIMTVFVKANIVSCDTW